MLYFAVPKTDVTLCSLCRDFIHIGGAIAVNNASLVTIITSTFTNNQAENGGAIFIEEVIFLLPLYPKRCHLFFMCLTRKFESSQQLNWYGSLLMCSVGKHW